MAGFQKIDKTQVPQVIGLGALSVGLFGFFAVKMITPTVSAAPTVKAAPAATAPAANGAPAPATPGGAAAAAGAAQADAAPPTAGMRDPFVGAVTPGPAAPPVPAKPAKPAPQVATAALPRSDAVLRVPFAPALPPGGGTAPILPPPAAPAPGRLSPMPVAPPAPAAPAWTVTGVLQSDSGDVAILRDGDARKFAHTGDLVGGKFRIVDVTRQFVVLQRGGRHYVLPLGGPKTAAPRPPTLAAAPDVAAPQALPQTTGASPGAPTDAPPNPLQQLAGKL